MKNKRQFWAGMLVSMACLAAIFLFIQPAEILKALRVARFEYVGLSVVGIIAFLMVRAVRWRFMLDNDVPWRTVLHIQNIGYLLTNILPFRVGDVARAVLIGNVPPVTLARGLSTMVVERILDMLFIVTLLPFTLAEVEQLPDWMRAGARISGILAVSAIVLLIIAANKRPLTLKITGWLLEKVRFLDTEAWLKRIDDLLAGLSSLTQLKSGLILLVLSIVIWIPILISYHLVLLSVNIHPTPAMTGFVVCAAALSIALPSSPGQIGVFHAGVIGALQVLGQPEAASASFAFLYHALNLLLMVLSGLVGLYGTGATFGQIVASTQAFITNRKTNES